MLARNPIASVTIPLLAALLSGLIAFQADAGDLAVAARPNVVLVMADDLGWSDVGCYGGEIPTPHIDSLARGGLRFTQFYNNAVCGPTRASLLTGLYCQQVGHRGDRWNEPKDYKRCVTIGEVLKQAGYRTAMVGKWQGRDSALDRGFERFFGPMCQAKISYFHEVVRNPYYLDRQRWQTPPDFYMTDAFNDYAEKFLTEALADEQPFFLYVAHIAPHWPLHARPRDIARHRARYAKLGWDACRAQRIERQRQMELTPKIWKLPQPSAIRPWNQEKHQAWQAERMAVYAAQVESIDRGLGRLLKRIDESGKRDNTLVLFLSDNGAAPDGGLAPSRAGFGFASARKPQPRWRLDGIPIRGGSGPDNLPGTHDTFAAYGLAWALTSNTPFRATKLTAYEGGIRTPLIARWPAVIKNRGGLTKQMGHVMDFMPTFIDVAQTRYPQALGSRRPLPPEGRSLLPIFQGKQRPGHAFLAWSAPRHHAIRKGKWKAIKPKTSKQWQLFDLEQDGAESTDLASREPERVRSLAQTFRQWQAKVGAR